MTSLEVDGLNAGYARALLDIGIAKGTYEQLGKDLDELAALYSGSRDLGEALTNPVFPMARRRAVLEAILERAAVSPITRNFALLVLDRERGIPVVRQQGLDEFGGTPIGTCIYGAINGWDTGHPRDHARTLALLLDAGARPDPTLIPTGNDGIDGVLRDWFRKSA